MAKSEEQLAQEKVQKAMARTLGAISWGELMECFKTLNENQEHLSRQMTELKTAMNDVLLPAIATMRANWGSMSEVEALFKKYSQKGDGSMDQATKDKCALAELVVKLAADGQKPQ